MWTSYQVFFQSWLCAGDTHGRQYGTLERLCEAEQLLQDRNHQFKMTSAVLLIFFVPLAGFFYYLGATGANCNSMGVWAHSQGAAWTLFCVLALLGIFLLWARAVNEHPLVKNAPLPPAPPEWSSPPAPSQSARRWAAWLRCLAGEYFIILVAISVWFIWMLSLAISGVIKTAPPSAPVYPSECVLLVNAAFFHSCVSLLPLALLLFPLCNGLWKVSAFCQRCRMRHRDED